jgi:hypothetical protein
MSIHPDELRVPYDFTESLQVRLFESSVIVTTRPEYFEKCRGLLWALGVMPPNNGRVLGYSSDSDIQAPDTLQVRLYDAEAAQAYGKDLVHLVETLGSMQALARDES